MNMKKSVIITLVLLLLVAVMIFTACEKPPVYDGADSTTAEITEGSPEPMNLLITENKQSQFVIIYPEGFDSAIKDIALSLRSAIQKYTGASLEIRSDKLLDKPVGDFGVEAQYEILLGPTNRDASKKLTETFRSRDYCVTVDGDKVVLAGITLDSIDMASERFINNVLLKQSKDNRGSATVIFTEENHFLYQYSKYTMSSCKLPGGDIEDYNIVYSKDDSCSAERIARLFKDYLAKKAGYVLDISTELAAGKDNEGNLPEIIFGITNRGGTPVTEPHGYTVTASGKKLFVEAECFEGYFAAYDYLTETLFASGDVEIKDGFTHSGVATIDPDTYMDSKVGEYRVIFNNIYGQDKAEHPITVRLQMQAELHNEFRPDIIGTQESTPHVGKYITMMSSYGYSSVPAVATNSNGCNYTPLFYRADKFDLIDYGYYLYNDEAKDKSKSVTWGVFKDKASGDVFAVGSTHFYYTSDSFGNSARLKDAAQLSQVVKSIVAKHNCPVIVGGDLNCNTSSQPFGVLFDEGFKHMHGLAVNKNDVCTHHAYPVFDSNLKLFTGMTMPTRLNSSSIDHAIIYNGGNVTTKLYRTVTHDYTLLSSDHCPVLVDFDVN